MSSLAVRAEGNTGESGHTSPWGIREKEGLRRGRPRHERAPRSRPRHREGLQPPVRPESSGHSEARPAEQGPRGITDRSPGVPASRCSELGTDSLPTSTSHFQDFRQALLTSLASVRQEVRHICIRGPFEVIICESLQNIHIAEQLRKAHRREGIRK